MSKSRSFRRALAVALVAGAVASACSGGGDKKADVTTSTVAATTTAATATTSTTAAATTTTIAATTTTAVPAPTYPLTGLPADDATKLNRPAMVVKVNNVASARPQHGINQADVVFEEKIGTSITRFLTVFQSQDSEKIGSIRSARASDLPILGSLSKPLFAWSGANEVLTPVVRDADVTDIGYSKHSELYDRGRLLPDYTEFFISTVKARDEMTPAGQGAPTPIFSYRKPTDATPTGSTPAGIRWTKNGYLVDWAWDSAKKVWLRNQNGTPHLDFDRVQVAPENVVFMFTEYRRAFDDPRSPESVSLGTGPAWVLTNGVVVPGTWTHGVDKDPFTFTDQGGNPIKLTPGRTWVELAEPDSGELVNP